MAKLIALTSYNGVDPNSAQDPTATTTQTVYINPDLIVDVQTRTPAYNTTGVTNVFYNLPVNNSNVMITLVVTQTAAAVAALAQATVSALAVGQTTLVAGTKAITISGLTTSNIALVTLVSSLTGSSTVTYQAVCTTNTLTLRANVAAGTINTADVSILNYAIVG